jgi:hypothetical protein
VPARPKRVGVLTFHRCVNYGSYWQARRLVEGLRRRGCQAELLDHRSRRVDHAEWRCALSPHLPIATPASDRGLYALKTRAFFEAFDQLPMSPPFALEDPAGMERYDLVVVGSDEVWNLSHPWFGGEPLFFGENLKADRLAAYAASAGNHGALALHDRLIEALQGFAHISVRDENARRLAHTAIGRDPPRVLDPCLQFAARQARHEDGEDVILYGHGFPAWLQRPVIAWARRRGRRLLSFGYRNAWADTQLLTAGPAAFNDAMAEAAAVVTNFFHGCVFALAERRPFVCVGTAYRADKIRDLLASVGAEDRLIDETTPAETIDHLLSKPPEASVRDRVEDLRSQSDRYLDAVLA